MKVQTKVFLARDMVLALDAASRRMRRSKSEIVQAAVAAYLSPDGDEMVEAAITRVVFSSDEDEGDEESADEDDEDDESEASAASAPEEALRAFFLAALRAALAASRSRFLATLRFSLSIALAARRCSLVGLPRTLASGVGEARDSSGLTTAEEAGAMTGAMTRRWMINANGEPLGTTETA